jgi:hypothetical protein
MNGRIVALGVVVSALLACTEAPALSPGVVDAAGLAGDTGSNAGVDAATVDDDATTDVQGLAETGTTDLGSSCLDMDEDGYPATECGGKAPDCDDNNAGVNPGRTEVCDPRGLDEDCNPCTVAGATDGDRDNDTFTSAACFNRYAGPAPTCDLMRVRLDGAMTRVTGGDCDDVDPNVRPNQSESCNNLDDNCNGMTDEGVLRTFFRDADGDGFGDRRTGAMSRMSCSPTQGYVENNTDCDDDPNLGASVNPGAREVCDGAMRDENCNGASNEGCSCVDGREYPCPEQRGRCAMSVQRCVGNTLGMCSYTAQREECNGQDDDCDGMVDDDLTVYTSYPDADNDNEGDRRAMPRTGCRLDPGYVQNNTDCNDMDRNISRVAREICDGVDQDCDGVVDDGAAATCATRPNASAACTAGTCRYTCNAGFGDCDNNSVNGCEATLSTDPNNCNRCGVRCTAPSGGTRACVSSVCTQGCPAPGTNCSGTCQTLTGTCNDGRLDYCRRTGNWVCSGTGRTCQYSAGGELTTSITYEGNSTALAHQCGSSSGGFWTLRGTLFPTAQVSPCYLQYGPYVSLPAGNYKATLFLRVAPYRFGGTDVATFFSYVADVNNATTRTLAGGPSPRREEPSSGAIFPFPTLGSTFQVVLDFNLTDCAAIEVRLYVRAFDQYLARIPTADAGSVFVERTVIARR